MREITDFKPFVPSNNFKVTKRFYFIVATLLLVMGCSKPPKLQVVTGEDAQRIVVEYLKLDVLAEQGFSVTGLLDLAGDVQDFGESGDRYWEVRRTNLLSGGNIDGLFWVNAETGVVLQVHPRFLHRTE
ncbi:MAG: hypothetical protein ACI9CB_002775 [Rhodothermales bacterium]